MKYNHLVKEKSPYLLQHAHNPVDWYPWGEEAFAKSRAENKPLLVSIGYSTCHWCHVMERESFSEETTAAIMNNFFVCVKVDREERPDVDKIYMTAVTTMTGSGGWPLNVFLTPELKPFFGGTYFAPQEQWGRASWPTLLTRIGEAWREVQARKNIDYSADNIYRTLQGAFAIQNEKCELDESVLNAGYNHYEAVFDSSLGGFGGAPKFPMPVNLNFLLRYYAFARERFPDKKKQAENALEMVLKTLTAMAKGGICDCLGGGFHRYSTDEYWHVPHFEKMLYDNSQLAVNYLEAYQVSRDAFYARTAKGILTYIERDMSHPSGGFYSAEDADSLPPRPAGEVSSQNHQHGKEGAFYVWEKSEIIKILGDNDGLIFCRHYGVGDRGNARTDPHNEFENKNILYQACAASKTAASFQMNELELESILERSRQKLFLARAERPRPRLDDKILVSWNGLMISGFAKAAQVFNDELYLTRALGAAQFIKSKLYDPEAQILYHRWRDGEKGVLGMADDYAFYIAALLDLYEAGFDPEWLRFAIVLSEEMRRFFYNEKSGGFYMTRENHDLNLIFRVQEDYDNVEPCASSVAAMNYLRLGRMTGRSDFMDLAKQLLEGFFERLKSQPAALPQMMCALGFALSKPLQVVVAGEKESSDWKALFNALHSRYIPNKVVVGLGEKQSAVQLSPLIRRVTEFHSIQGKATAYICVNYSCQRPTNDLNEIQQMLDKLN